MLIPTADEIIDWAEKTGFKFRQCSIGNDKCGCALTAIARINNIPINDMTYAWLDSSIGSFEVCSIARGFDSPQFDINERFRSLGRDVYFKAKERGLLV